MTKDNRLHYDSITLAWNYIMGKHFHFGYFSNGDESLDNATDALVYEMASLINLKDTIKVLDVGCGVGHSALILHEICDCTIHGITNSLVGVREAEINTNKNNGSGSIVFSVNDAIDTGLPDSSYDVVWMMETSHLIPNKKALVREAFRLLKPGGLFLLCDIILLRKLSLLEINKLQKKLLTLDNAFGKANTITFDNYKTELLSTGFNKIETIDISDKTSATFIHWKANAIRNKKKIISTVDLQYHIDFIEACEIMSDLTATGILGYGIVSANKPA